MFFFLSSSYSAIGIPSAYSLPEFPQNFCSADSTFFLLSSTLQDVFLIPFMSLPENVEEEDVEKSVSHGTILKKNHCGHSESLVPFPFVIWKENPGGCLEAVLLPSPRASLGKEFNVYLCYLIPSSMRGKWSPSQ